VLPAKCFDFFCMSFQVVHASVFSNLHIPFMITEAGKLFQKPIVRERGTLIKIECFIVVVGR
jgi:hypothetical protein